MAKRISKSNENLSFDDVADIYNYRENSLRLYFSDKNPNFLENFVGYTKEEINEELEIQLSEVEKDACLTILACVEAKFRIDYIIRCEKRYKDEISRKFREIFIEYEYRVSLEESILNEWKNLPQISSSIISDIKGAFKYRHWLAHGRYWTYKSTKYDFYGIYNLAQKIDELNLYE